MDGHSSGVGLTLLFIAARDCVMQWTRLLRVFYRRQTQFYYIY